MKARITIAILVIVLAFVGIRSVVQSYEYSRHISYINASYAALQASLENLTDKYLDIVDRNAAMNTNYYKLQSDYDSLSTSNKILSDNYAALAREVIELEYENRDLQTILDEYEKVPHSYYSSGTFMQHSNTYDDLCYFLTVGFKVPPYKLDIFDCSESAAYVEWALENAGFDAEIVTGTTPWDTNSYHAWVIANTNEYQVAIEATWLTDKIDSSVTGRVPGIIYGEDDLIPEWNNYYEKYDDKYQNIYCAIRYSGVPNEWNWWDGISGLK
jgi:cell division protein FtsB